MMSVHPLHPISFVTLSNKPVMMAQDSIIFKLLIGCPSRLSPLLHSILIHMLVTCHILLGWAIKEEESNL
jgi:hypothetical protein